MPARRVVQETQQAGLDPAELGVPGERTVLYVLIAFAATQISEVPDNDLALGLWGLQITINILWTGVFFGLHLMLAGAVIIAALWVTVLATTVAFWTLDPTVALMILPYLIGGTYALALNTSVWLRNRNRAVPVE